MDRQEAAETLALQAVAWLAGHDDLLPVFLGASGLSERDLRTGLDQPDLLAAVLDFLLMDDAWVIQFCDAHGLGYDQPQRAREALPGGAAVHWT
jgi:hypothetical protein